MNCPKCGSPMKLTSVSPGKGKREARWYKCTNPECEHEEGRLVYRKGDNK